MTLLRSALFNVFFFAVTFVLTVGPATPVRLVAPHRMLDVARLWARVMVWGVRVICGIRLQVSGLEHVGSGAALIASHHQSAFDTFVWLTLVPRCCYVLKQRVAAHSAVRSADAAHRHDRGGSRRRRRALRGLLREGERAMREERQIVIFPEGTRAEPGAMLAATAGRRRAGGANPSAGGSGGDRFGPLLGAPGVPQASWHHSYPSARTDPGRTSGATSLCSASRRHCGPALGRTLWAEFAATSGAIAVGPPSHWRHKR